MSALQKSLMKKLPPRCPKTNAAKLAPMGPGRRRDYTPVTWRQYFSEARDIVTQGGTFRVYLSPEPDHSQRPRIVTLHGGGYSGLSWSLFTEEVTSMVECQVVSMDLRGHGETSTHHDDDLAGETLVNDVKDVILKLFGPEPPPIILIGHSMGGAIAVLVASHPQLEPFIHGIAVIDVVEGTAMESLASMQSFLRSRPTHFKSIEHAIEWCVRSGQVRNVESAKVSMPSQIVNCETGRLATYELDNYTPTSPDESPQPMMRLPGPDAITEESEDGETEEGETHEFTPPHPPATALAHSADHKYTWRIDLSKTERYWAGWFEGLSSAFLSVRAPRLLLLASIDGLDRELTVGQMQGKFQMQVLTRCGHAVHEDSPGEVARVLAAFALRHRLTEPTPEGSHMCLVSAPGC